MTARAGGDPAAPGRARAPASTPHARPSSLAEALSRRPRGAPRHAPAPPAIRGVADHPAGGGRAGARRATQARLLARETLVEIREQRLDGMAAEIAGKLAVGAYCPVCGSADHPAPASPGSRRTRRGDRARGTARGRRPGGRGGGPRPAGPRPGDPARHRARRVRRLGRAPPRRGGGRRSPASSAPAATAAHVDALAARVEALQAEQAGPRRGARRASRRPPPGSTPRSPC